MDTNNIFAQSDKTALVMGAFSVVLLGLVISILKIFT
ncbi:hypothetical protein UFO1_2810 [Pelosinus sp. UFO1]|jgi:hypothetical protein|nr:hypothetical protein UFO1_2810 [Pelosinus sp. UFO1]